MKRRYYFVALSLLPLVLIWRSPGLTDQTQMFSHTILKPFLAAGTTVSNSVSGFFDYFVLFLTTFEEQQKNKQLILSLETKLSGFEEVQRENARLRRLLELREQNDPKAVAARVIGWDLSPWRKTIILDKGSHHGVKEDMAVVVPEGAAGRILSVGVSTSRAILLLDPDARVSALSSESRAHGMISGDGGRHLWFRYLDLDSGVQVGETVLSSGLTGVFPKGLRIGTVESVEKDSDGLHLVAKVRPFSSMRKLEEVLCIGSSRTK